MEKIKSFITSETFFSWSTLLVIVAVAIWAIRLEGHAAQDAKEILFVREKLSEHEARQNSIEVRIGDSLQNIDRRLSRIEGKLGVE